MILTWHVPNPDSVRESGLAMKNIYTFHGKDLQVIIKNAQE